MATTKGKGPRLEDHATIETMLPMEDMDRLAPLKANMKKMLRVNDEQIALNRYVWHNLPRGINGQLIERILYYRGSGMFFYMPETDLFYFLPYCLNGTIDLYGRYKTVSPLPFMGKDDDAQKALLSTMLREPVYDFAPQEVSSNPFDALKSKCVLLYDYCPQLSQTILPRQKINEGIIDIESNIIPYLNTLLSNNTGVNGVRVNDDGEQSSVSRASDTCNLAALNGKRWIPITGPLDFQDLGSPVAGSRAEDMLLAMEAIDNIRIGTYGVDNGGIFEKKAHLLESENRTSNASTGLVCEDGLWQRREFANLINSWFMEPADVDPSAWVWVEVNPTTAAAEESSIPATNTMNAAEENNDGNEGGNNDGNE